MLFWSAVIFGTAARNWLTVTPGSRRINTGDACASPVTVETIRTPPDCRVPPTVIFLPVIVIVIVGRLPAGLAATAEAGCVGAAPAMPADSATETVAASEMPARAALLVSLVRMIGPSAK